MVLEVVVVSNTRSPEALTTKVSLPAPPSMVSLPVPPSKVSFPPSAEITSASSVGKGCPDTVPDGVIVLFPSVPVIVTPVVTLVTVTAIACVSVSVPSETVTIRS